MSSSEAANATKAIVYEFTCLFTHDLKRKQKRWQDGKLKYHTFNGKVMVYDDRGNYVGESRWQEEEELADGDEFPLDRGGAIVQVAECTGSHEQDLADLVDKRAKEVQQRRVEKAARQGGRTGFSTPQSSLPGPPRTVVGHRPLNTLIGSPARIGRAIVPTKSPYEVRHVVRACENEGDAPLSGTSKRKRDLSPPSRKGHARALFGTQLSFANPSSIAQARRQVLSQRPANVASSVQTSLSEVAKASQGSDVEEISSHSLRAQEGEDNRLPKERVRGAKPRSEPPTKTAQENSAKAESQSLPKHSPVEALPASQSMKEFASDSHDSKQRISPKHRFHGDTRDGQLAEERQQHKCQREQKLELDKQQDMREAKRQRQREQRLDSSKPMANVEVIDLEDGHQDKPLSTSTSTTALRKPELLPPNEDEPLSLSKLKPAKRKALHSTIERRAPDATASRAERNVGVSPSRAADIDSAAALLPSRTSGLRTELRIGSRRKRGLLMISERKLVGAPRPQTSTSHIRIDQTGRPSLSDDDASSNRPQSRDSRDGSRVQRKSQNKGGNVEYETDIRSSKVRGAQKDNRKHETANEEESLFVQASTTCSDEAGISGSQVVSRSICEHDEEDIENSKKPRIARLARKSVRSREIFGYVPDDAAPTIAFSAAAPQDQVFEKPGAESNASVESIELAEEPACLPSLNEEHLVDNDVPSDPDEVIGDALVDPTETPGEAGAMPDSHDADAAFEDWLAQMSSPPGAPEVKETDGDGADTLLNMPRKTAGVTAVILALKTSEKTIPETAQYDPTVGNNRASERQGDKHPHRHQCKESASSAPCGQDLPMEVADTQDSHAMPTGATLSTAVEASHESVEGNNIATRRPTANGAQDNEIIKSIQSLVAPAGQMHGLPHVTLVRGDAASMVSEDKKPPAENATPQPLQDVALQPAQHGVAELADHCSVHATGEHTSVLVSRDADVCEQTDDPLGGGPEIHRSPAASALAATNLPDKSDKRCLTSETTSATSLVLETPASVTAGTELPTKTTTATELPEERGGSSEATPNRDDEGLHKASLVPKPSPGHLNSGKPRILVNPATRGKKAASKAHAAGAAPRSLVHLDPPSISSVPRRRAQAMPPPRKKSHAGPMPAFEKASGGAWSAHAGDLLGISHPMKK